MVLEDPVTVPDGAGGYTLTWEPRGEVWAMVLPGVGRAGAQEGVTLAESVVRIVVRGAPFGAPSRPRAEQRLREGVRVFVISAVSEYEADGRYLTCFAREEVAA
jgi:head-tail adaptor